MGGSRKKSFRPYLLVGVAGIIIIAGLIIFIGNFLQNQSSSPEQATLQAAPPKVWKIGVLMSTEASYNQLGAFKQKMEQLGRKEGVDVEYVVQLSNRDQEVLERQVKESLADSSIDIVYSIGGSYKGFEFKEGEPQRFDKKVVFSNVADLARLGLSGLFSAIMNQGLNFTGVLCGNTQLIDRRMGILKEIVPDAKTFGTILTPEFADAARIRTLLQQAADKHGVQLLIIEEVDEDIQLQRAKEEFTKDTIDGYVQVPGTGRSQEKELAQYFIEEGIPAMTFSHTNPVSPNYIAALANDPPDQARQAAIMASLSTKTFGTSPFAF